MRGLFVLGAGLLLTLAGGAAVHWSSQPLPAGCAMRGDCSSCHAGSAPRTHTREFIDGQHGPSARANRSECAACHVNPVRDCAACHLRQAPAWHSDALRNPGLGAHEAREHVRLARQRLDSCIECHADSYRARCVGCHRPEEHWLGRALETTK